MVCGFCLFPFLNLITPLEFCGWTCMYLWDWFFHPWFFYSISNTCEAYPEFFRTSLGGTFSADISACVPLYCPPGLLSHQRFQPVLYCGPLQVTATAGLGAEAWAGPVLAISCLCNAALFFLAVPRGRDMRNLTILPQPGMEPSSPAVEAWILNHWTTREVPAALLLVPVHVCPPHSIHFLSVFMPGSLAASLATLEGR